MMWWLAILAPALAADCETPTSTQDVFDAVGSAHADLTEVDIDAFKAHADQAMAAVPCVTDSFNKHMAAELHRLQGLRRAIDGEKVRSAQAFAAARTLEPAYAFPLTMVPEGSPVVGDYQTLPIDTGASAAVPVPATGSLLFDSRSGGERPQHWPTLVQLLDGDGAVAQTAYLWPDDPMIAYEASALAPLPDPDPQPKPKDRRSLGAPLLGGAIAAGVASGALYGISASNKAKWRDPTTPNAEIETLQGSINSTAAGSVGAGVLALGLGVTAVVVW